jgi:YVTN family beta-propeller protein
MEVDMLKRYVILPILFLIACSGRVPGPDTEGGVGRKTFIPQGTSQIVVYAASESPITLPVVWEIRKISLNLADGRQVDLPGSQTSLSLSGIRGGQSLLAISEIATGSYTGLTLFTREVHSEITGQPVSLGGTYINVEHDFSVVGGNSKTLTLLIDLEYAGSPETAQEFLPVIAVEPENHAPAGNVVYVANEGSSNISVIDVGAASISATGRTACSMRWTWSETAWSRPQRSTTSTSPCI